MSEKWTTQAQNRQPRPKVDSPGPKWTAWGCAKVGLFLEPQQAKFIMLKVWAYQGLHFAVAPANISANPYAFAKKTLLLKSEERSETVMRIRIRFLRIRIQHFIAFGS